MVYQKKRRLKVLEDLKEHLQKLKGRIILHFSDIQTGFTSLHEDELHTTSEEQQDDIFNDAIADYHNLIGIINEFKKIELVVISGDLGSTGKKDDYEKLKPVLNFFHEKELPILIVPGNHEVNWDVTKKKIKKIEKIKGKKTTVEINKFKNFQIFLREFTKNETRVKYKYEGDYCYYLLPGSRFLFIGVNSNKRIDHLNKNDAFIPLPYLRKIKKEISSEISSFMGNFKNILICHHDLDTLYSCNPKLLQHLNLDSYFLILSGHLHRNDIKKEEDFNLTNICVGSILTSVKERIQPPRGSDPIPRQFNLYSIEGEFVNVKVDILHFSYIEDRWNIKPNHLEFEFSSDRIRCRSCGVKVSDTKKIKIIWDDKLHAFSVYIECYCKPCHSKWSTDIIKHLTTEVARNSYCECGGLLNLVNYSIKAKNYELKFSGIYICNKCNQEKRISVSNLKSRIRKKWRSIDKILFNDQGISYIKD